MQGLLGRFAILVSFLVVIAVGATAQTLTVNKFQETPSGQQLDSTTANIGTLVVYRVVISSSDASKNPLVNVKDTLPTGFVLVNVTCAGQNSALCPNNSAVQTFSGLTSPVT